MTKFTDNEWLELILDGQSNVHNSKEIPTLPPEDLQTRTVGRSGREALTDALYFKSAVEEIAKRLGRSITADTTILDFGSGWGRMALFFMRELNVGSLICADPNPEYLIYAARAIHKSTCIITNTLPPIGIKDQFVDIVYSYSVFSHLSEAATIAWLNEFDRILKPGGIACLTTRPRAHIEQGGIHIMVDPHTPQPIIEYGKLEFTRIYDQGGFVFLPMKSSTGGTYGEAAISAKYAESLKTKLVFIEMIENYSPIYLQPILVFQKPF